MILMTRLWSCYSILSGPMTFTRRTNRLVFYLDIFSINYVILFQRSFISYFYWTNIFVCTIRTCIDSMILFSNLLLTTLTIPIPRSEKEECLSHRRLVYQFGSNLFTNTLFRYLTLASFTTWIQITSHIENA